MGRGSTRVGLERSLFFRILTWNFWLGRNPGSLPAQIQICLRSDSSGTHLQLGGLARHGYPKNWFILLFLCGGPFQIGVHRIGLSGSFNQKVLVGKCFKRPCRKSRTSQFSSIAVARFSVQKKGDRLSRSVGHRLPAPRWWSKAGWRQCQCWQNVNLWHLNGIYIYMYIYIYEST